MRSIAKPRKNLGTKSKPAAAGVRTLEDFVTQRDYTGALALLEFKLKCGDGDMKDLLMWVGYCAFHLGNFKRAEDAYKQLLEEHDDIPMVYLYLACCYFFQQSFEEAEAYAEKGPNDSLKTRLLFNIAHRMGDENKLMKYHQNLKDTKDDQLSLAAVHYLRSHHQEVYIIYTCDNILAYLYLDRPRTYTKDSFWRTEKILL